jgi:hypothetical protein
VFGGAACVVAAKGGGGPEDALGVLGSGGDLRSGPLKDEFGFGAWDWDWEGSRRSPLRFLPRPLRPPSKLRSCCPSDVSEGRWGDGLDEPASPGPRSFLLRFGGIVKSGIAGVGSFIEVRHAAGRRRLGAIDETEGSGVVLAHHVR